jgi:hypothetical protein
MNQHLLVKMRQLVLTRSYQEPPADTPRLAVTSPCNDQETRAMCDLLKPYVPEVKDNAVAAVRVVFRYTLANAPARRFTAMLTVARARVSPI